MTMTRKNRGTGRKLCPTTTWWTTNLTCKDAGSNADLRGYRSATDRPSHGTAL